LIDGWCFVMQRSTTRRWRDNREKLDKIINYENEEKRIAAEIEKSHQPQRFSVYLHLNGKILMAQALLSVLLTVYWTQLLFTKKTFSLGVKIIYSTLFLGCGVINQYFRHLSKNLPDTFFDKVDKQPEEMKSTENNNQQNKSKRNKNNLPAKPEMDIKKADRMLRQELLASFGRCLVVVSLMNIFGAVAALLMSDSEEFYETYAFFTALYMQVGYIVAHIKNEANRAIIECKETIQTHCERFILSHKNSAMRQTINLMISLSFIRPNAYLKKLKPSATVLEDSHDDQHAKVAQKALSNLSQQARYHLVLRSLIHVVLAFAASNVGYLLVNLIDCLYKKTSAESCHFLPFKASQGLTCGLFAIGFGIAGYFNGDLLIADINKDYQTLKNS
jgi:hypothetical protein